MAQVRVTPSGNLDKDGELSYISNGNYVDANDIRHRQSVGNNFGGIMGTNGNLNLITTVNGSAGTTLPAVGTSSKLYRIYIDYSYVASGAVTTMSGTLSLTRTSGVKSIEVVNLTPSSITNLAFSLQAEFNLLHLTAFGGGSFTFNPSTAPYYTSTGTNTGYFTLTTSSDTDYVLQVTNDNEQVPLCKIVLETEYIGTATTLRPTGSYQLEDYLFIWSASETSTGVKSDVSEIGVVYSTNQGSSYQYKTLCRSRNLGFYKERRIDAQVEKAGAQINFYWTDGNEKPRAMYLDYSRVTTQNGFMYWEGGRYEHDTIDDESAFFFKVSKAYIDNIDVVNEGGTLTAGNKRYTGRFLTEDLVTSEFLYPTNPINIYGIDTITPSLIYGAESDFITTKSVNMVVKNITPNIYKYFELAVIEYVDDAFTTTNIQRYTIADGETELNVRHVGRGQDNIPLGVNELLAIYTRYTLAENIRIFDNRVVLSNLKEQVDFDLQTWAAQITHSLESKTIPALGGVVESYHDFLDDVSHSPQPSTQLQALQYGLDEYLNPLNTLNNTSYMFNDTYRFGIQVKWKANGKWSSPYWVDDIRFDNLSSNVIGSRRTANNITSNLTDSTDENVYVNYVKFSNIQLDHSVSGTPLRDLIEGFRFVRAERIPEVLATGYFFLGDTYGTNGRKPFALSFGSVLTDKLFTNTDVNTTTDIITITAHGLSENEPVLFKLGTGSGVGGLVDDFYYYVNVVNANEIKLKETPNGPVVDLTSAAAGNYQLFRGYETKSHLLTPTNGSDALFFHSPDHYYIDRDYQFTTSTHQIKILGPSKSLTMVGVGTGIKDGIYSDFSGYFSSAKRAYLTLDDTTTPVLEDYALLDYLTTKPLPVGAVVASGLGSLLCDVFGLSLPLRPSTGSYFSAGLANSEAEGVFYGQVFIDLGANQKYPANKENTVYESTGHFYYTTPTQTGVLNNIEVFGGDVFTQKTHLPIAIDKMIGCYSQNVVNTQMVSVQEDPGDNSIGYRWPVYSNKAGTVTHYIWPRAYYNSWYSQGNIWSGLANFFAQTIPPQRYYNRSYDYKDRSLTERGYFKNDRFNGDSPTKIVWSAKKAIGSNKDNYRLGFGPTEFAELDLTYGPIVHHEVINNSFYSLQPFSFQRQYFRDASLIGAQEGTDVVVGSGSILGSPGQELTSIGSEYKWSQFKGQTEGGKESFYWYNNRLKKIMRFGMDGVRPISEKGVITLLQKNTNWLLDKKYPLSGAGIHGVWNDKYGEAIFTLKAINPNIAAWVTSTSYTAGTYVFITPASTYLHASGLPYVYKAKLTHTSGASTKPETGASWQTNWAKIEPGTDAFAHTCLTLVYDELKNGFVGTHSYWPDIYLPYQNTFWSPNPNAKNTLFLHDENGSQTYYGAAYIPTITGVMNIEPNISKNFEAIQVNSEISPSFADFYTKNHQSYLDETEFDAREGYFYSPIKNDILTAPSGTPIENTTRLWGKWLKVKLYLEGTNNNQRLINFIVKFRVMPRLYNQ